MKNRTALKAFLDESKKAKWSMHSGRKSSFKEVEKLIAKIKDLRESGMPVSTNMAILMGSQMDSSFKRKSKHSKYHIMRRLLRSNGIVIRCKTHEAQTHPKEKQEEARLFVEAIRPLIQQPKRAKEYIANMDQTPVFFSMVPTTTLETQGSRTVNVRASSGSTIRVTLAVFVTAAGDTLPPYMIFKGSPTGRIAKELKDKDKGYPEGVHYSCQPKAWMDERCCLEWVQKVLKPWADSAPEDIVPLLLLDSYKCHLQASVHNAIEECGVHLEYIPGGCTSLCQPVDIGINKPLKNRIRSMWEQYMLEEGLQEDTTKPPSRQTVAQWCTTALKELDGDLVRNSWRRSEGYSYFPDEEKESSNGVEELEDLMDELSISHLESSDDDDDDDNSST